MQPWRSVWRVIAHLASIEGLRALEEALECDSPALLQGSTVHPWPLPDMVGRAPEGACPIATLGLGDGLATVGEVDEFFARMCEMVDVHMNERGAARWFANWWDETERDAARVYLLEEVRFALGLGPDPVALAPLETYP